MDAKHLSLLAALLASLGGAPLLYPSTAHAADAVGSVVLQPKEG